MTPHRIRAAAYLLFAAGGAAHLSFSPSLVLAQVSTNIAAVYGVTVLLGGLGLAFASWTDRPLIELAVIPIAAMSGAAYFIASASFGKYGMAFVILSHSVLLLSRWVQVNRSVDRFRKEVRE